MTVKTSAKLTRKYQITIPSEIRRRLGLEAGDTVFLSLEEGKVVLSGQRGGWTERYRGLGADAWKREGGAAAAIERERESWDEK